MIGKKINQLATELAPTTTDLTIIGDPISGVSKKITLEQLGAIFGGAVSFYTTLGDFPATGVIDIIYCAKDTKKLYLWSGSAYTEVFPSQSLLDTYQLRSEKGNANGYASLDSSGKVPVSQLPSSIMEYKGMWNAATNTPTLANGTGDTGDVYICNVAGTVNFGAGAITFAVGDYVIYSGSIWQRSSGAVGTVTSVAATITGDAIGITGSPVTTSGTLALAFAGTSGQYINGAGNLTTFPTLTGYVPYTGATANVDLGTHTLLAKDLVINHSSGSGVAASITKGGAGEALTVVKSSGSGNAASITGGVTLLDELHLNTDLADTYIASASNWNAAYNDKINSAAVTGTTTKTLTLTQQDGGTITASWTDDNTDAVTSVFGRTGAVVATSGDYNTSQVTENTNLYFTNARAIASTLTGYTSGAGTISATDTILSAIQKLNGNIGALTTGVSSVNGLTGAVTLTTSNIAEGTNLYYTEARVNANTNVAANTAARHNAVTLGTANGLSLSTQVLSLALASGSTTGALSSSDWTTFNSKQSALTNPVTGTGTTNYLPKFTGTSTIGNSLIQDDGTTVSITRTAGDLELSLWAGNTTTAGNSILGLYAGTGAGNLVPYGTIKVSPDAAGNTRAAKMVFGVRQSGGALLDALTINASGNLGLGVTPSAWTVYGPILQIGNVGSIVSASGEISIGNNWYYNSGDKYVTNNFASFYQQYGGQHRWFNAPSGTAGNAISFTQAMTLNASGRLSLGGTTITDNSLLNIEGSTVNHTIGIILNKTNGTAQVYGIVNQGPFDIYNYTSSSNMMRINASGNLSIGNTNDTYKLDVSGTGRFSDGTQGLMIRAYTGTDGWGAIYPVGVTPNTSNYTLIAKSTSAVLNASTSVTLAVGDSGKLTANSTGISVTGAATFSSNIIIDKGTGSGTILQGKGGSDNSVRASISFDTDYSTFSSGGNRLKLFDYSGTGITIDNGKVGIGTTSPAYKLQVSSTVAEVMRLQGMVGNVSSNNTQLRFFGSASNTDLWAIGTEVSTGTSDRAFDFYDLVAGANRIRITSGGNLEIATGSIKTGEPDTGYGRAAVKIGTRQSGTATDSGGYIPISIDGTVYFINLYTSTP